MRGSVVFLALVSAAACGDDDITGTDAVGTLRVAVATSGADLDLDGYALTVDDTPHEPVGANETILIPRVPTGAHDVALTGVADNCAVNGTALRSVTVGAGDTSQVAYAVTCRATGLKITAATTGVDPDPDGYQVTVDGAPPAPLGVLGSLIVTRLSPGAHTIALTGLAANCAVSEDNPRAVVVTLGEIIPVSFAVTCTAGTGALAVTAATTGTDVDASYVIRLPGQAGQALPANGTVVLSGLPPGNVTVSLDDVAGNCTVAGDNPRTVTVTVGGVTIDTVATTFDVGCRAVAGIVEVTAVTSGADYDLDGYAVRLDAGGAVPLAGDTTVTYELDGGDHRLTLEGVAGNCTVSGTNPRTVTISVGGATRDTVRTTFAVSCAKTWAIAYSRTTDVSMIRVSNAAGTEQGSLTTGDAPAWSPDGTRLAFVRVTCSYDWYYYNNYCFPAGIAAATVTTGSVITTLTSNGSDADPAWRPDGTRIAFTRGATLTLMNPDGSGVTGLAAAGHAAHPAWSPDGTALAFTCQIVSGDWDICVVNADGTGFLRLTSDPAQDARPAWSPDGARIVFVTTRYTGSQELALMNADGSAVTRLAPGTPAIQPAWSADGTKIVYTPFSCDVYVGCTTVGVWVMNADGTGSSQITTGRDSGPSWRP